MSREIKFRAWYKGTMVPWEWLDKSLNDLWTAINAQQYENPEPILMQYTGLTDKNGTEIYEFDLVGNPEDEPHIIDKVVWRRSGWELQSVKDDWDTSSITNNLIVIGNIYENPELLDVQAS